jgi:hypothetical protein
MNTTQTRIGSGSPLNKFGKLVGEGKNPNIRFNGDRWIDADPYSAVQFAGGISSPDTDSDDWVEQALRFATEEQAVEFLEGADTTKRSFYEI